MFRCIYNMRTGVSTPKLDSWVVRHGLTLPSHPCLASGTVIVPSNSGILHYVPKKGDQHFREDTFILG